jgi:hypothetical protein
MRRAGSLASSLVALLLAAAGSAFALQLPADHMESC